MGTEGVDASQVKMGVAKTGGCCNKNVLLCSLGFIFVILNLAALWALHFADHPVTKGSLRSATRFSTDQLSATEGSTPSVGDSLSFNTNNVLRAGAGTTAYLNKLTLGTDLADILYVNFAPMGTSDAYYSTNVMSYVRTKTVGSTSTTDSVVSTLSYSASNKSLEAGDAVVLTSRVRGLATLSDTLMAVLTVGTDYVVSAFPATLDGAAGSITANQAKAKEITKGSPTNFITPLSSSSFIVAYYEKYDATGYWQSARVGSVGSDGTITLSTAAKNFGVKNDADFVTNFGSPLALKGLRAGTGFIIPYYTQLNPWTGTTKTISDLSGLCVSSATFASNAQSAFTSVCNTAYRPSQFPESVALSDNAMAIVFHDEANNNALTVATLSVSSDKSLHFRSSYVFPEVSGDFDLYDLSTTPRPRVLTGNRLAVSFLNPTLNGRLSVRVLSFSPSTLSLKELTPVLPVAPPTFSLYVSDSTNYSLNKAIVHDMLPVGADGFVTVYVGKRNNVLHQNFAVTEAFGNPVGIVQSTSSDKSSITMQGKAEVDGLTAGVMHYATTSGAVVAPDSKSTDSNSAEFFYTAEDTILVTMDSRVGLAIDDDTLFVSTSF
ncbi:hypothetical protein PI124_g5645 [Phytophthora idaei]|nr:hypothetical protein PI125_g4715 [Phytophthora idaei]KAG3249707.1 hypothetical protein PI124_g5645 [Phytophthora idaei]